MKKVIKEDPRCIKFSSSDRVRLSVTNLHMLFCMWNSKMTKDSCDFLAANCSVCALMIDHL